MSYHFAIAGLEAAGYTGSNDRAAAGFNQIMAMEIAMSQALNLGTQISPLSEAVSAVSGVSANVTGGIEVGGRF